VQKCRVSFRDRQGIEHSVYLEAANRFHAFGRAMHEMRQCSWCNPDYREVQRMTIQILDGPLKGRRMAVTREQFESWLGAEPSAGESDRLRDYMKMLLSRIEPSRGFKKGNECGVILKILCMKHNDTT
jgi:hypothetical protein